MSQSSAQADWLRIANDLKEQLELKIKDVSKMSGGECFDLARAFREALWFEIQATSFDKRLDKDSQAWD